MLKFFVRSAKYIEMSVFSCISIWDINFENPIVSLNTNCLFWAQKIWSLDGISVVATWFVTFHTIYKVNNKTFNLLFIFKVLRRFFSVRKLINIVFCSHYLRIIPQKPMSYWRMKVKNWFQVIFYSTTVTPSIAQILRA